MKELIGSPGTVSGLTLRIAQCAFAAASIGVMVSTSDFSTYTAFWYFCFPFFFPVLSFTFLDLVGFFCFVLGYIINLIFLFIAIFEYCEVESLTKF